MILNIPDQIVSAYVCATVIFGGLIILFGLLLLFLRTWEETSSTLYRHCKAWKDLNDAAKQLRRGRRNKE